LLALIVLGLDSNVWRLREFVLHFILAGLITTVCFFFLPAACPVGAYGYEATPMQQRFLDHFFALRAGEFPLVSMNNLEGLITFPSFHTTWALLVAYAFRHYRWLFAPMILLNAGVAISTVTTGFHYATDVIGGIVTAAVAVMICDRLAPWLQSGREESLASLFGGEVVAN
jgi:membrane-associated phospholipid phosphatase